MSLVSECLYFIYAHMCVCAFSCVCPCLYSVCVLVSCRQENCVSGARRIGEQISFFHNNPSFALRINPA